METREVRDVAVSERRLGRDLLGQAAQAGAEDDADARLGRSSVLADRRLGFLDLDRRVQS